MKAISSKSAMPAVAVLLSSAGLTGAESSDTRADERDVAMPDQQYVGIDLF
jgi:hypothetical protein